MEDENNKKNNQNLTETIYSNIERIMDSILENRMDNAISLLAETKELQKKFNGNETDLHRINEELAELTNLIKYSGRFGDETLKKRIKKAKEDMSLDKKIDRNKILVDEIYYLIDQLMDSLAIDDRKTAAKIMIKIKKLYTLLDGYIVDKHRIYEEVAELKKILYEREIG